MTSTTINYVLSGMGYSMDTWASFSDISLITMLQDTNVLIHPEYMRLRFNTTEELLEISYGTQVGSNFTSHLGETTNFTPDSFVPFSELCGIVNTVFRSPHGTYYNKYFGYPPKQKII